MFEAVGEHYLENGGAVFGEGTTYGRSGDGVGGTEDFESGRLGFGERVSGSRSGDVLYVNDGEGRQDATVRLVGLVEGDWTIAIGRPTIAAEASRSVGGAIGEILFRNELGEVTWLTFCIPFLNGICNVLLQDGTAKERTPLIYKINVNS